MDAEIRKQAGEATDEENVSSSATPRQLVTADGTYATQSVFSTGSAASKKEERMWAVLLLLFVYVCLQCPELDVYFMFSPSFVYLIIYNRITCMWLLVSGFCLSMYLSNCSPPLRAHLLNGDFFVGSSLATSLVKMVTRYSSQMTEEQSCNVRGSHDLMCDIIITSLGVCCRSHANDC